MLSPCECPDSLQNFMRTTVENLQKKIWNRWLVEKERTTYGRSFGEKELEEEERSNGRCTQGLDICDKFLKGHCNIDTLAFKLNECHLLRYISIEYLPYYIVKNYQLDEW